MVHVANAVGDDGESTKVWTQSHRSTDLSNVRLAYVYMKKSKLLLSSSVGVWSHLFSRI